MLSNIPTTIPPITGPNLLTLLPARSASQTKKFIESAYTTTKMAKLVREGATRLRTAMERSVNTCLDNSLVLHDKCSQMFQETQHGVSTANT